MRTDTAHVKSTLDRSWGPHLAAIGVLASIVSLWCFFDCSAYAAKKEQVIHGAGATFPYPLYAKWAERYQRLTGVKLRYQAIGSGGGIAQIKARTVDFGASDRPLDKAELDREGMIQFPMVIGGVVPVVNVSGLQNGQIRLTPELLSEIFLGRIRSWDDRRIEAVNSHLRLPGDDITVVHRADGSGTTWIFTTYLTKVSKIWKEKVGAAKSVAWPSGLGAKGNMGVAELVQKVPGAIGYVEYAYALKNHLNYVALKNKDDGFVKPTIRTFQAAAENADWESAPGFVVDLTNQSGRNTWPITGTSYILIHKVQKDRTKAETLLKFFDWCYGRGGSLGVELHYVPIPRRVYELVRVLWKNTITCDGSPVWK